MKKFLVLGLVVLSGCAGKKQDDTKYAIATTAGILVCSHSVKSGCGRTLSDCNQRVKEIQCATNVVELPNEQQ